jgi:uncharacterized protein YkwD
MRWQRWFGLVLVGVACVSACASRGSRDFRAGDGVVERIPVPDEVASVYMSEARPDGAVGGPGIEALRAEIAAALAERGTPAEADGALSAAASWALRELTKGRQVDPISVETISRRFGFGGVFVGLAAGNATDGEPWREQLARLPANIPLNRYGIRTSPSGRLMAVAFGSAELTYESIPRSFDPGQTVTIRGAVGSRYTRSSVYLTKPDGNVEEKRLTSRSFDVSFPLLSAGRYRLEVFGDGPTGPVVVSNVPLFVGIAEPAATTVGGKAVDPEEAEASALVLLNQARRAAGLGQLVQDRELRELALAHSDDMASNDFFGHVSPTTGGPEDRLRRSGFIVAAFGENVGTGPTPEVIHEGLMESPGHRANMISPKFTHVGIGVEKDGDSLFCTMVFGRRPGVDALPKSAVEIESAILELRAAKKLSTPTVDPVYRVAAQAGADALADGDDPEEFNQAVGAAIQREVTRLRTSRPASCAVSLELLELPQLEAFPVLSMPTLRRIGVGVHPRRDDKGVRVTTVIVLDGTPCVQ